MLATRCFRVPSTPRLRAAVALPTALDLFPALVFAIGFGFWRIGPRLRDAPTIAPAATPSGPAMTPPMSAPATARTTRLRRLRLMLAGVVLREKLDFFADGLRFLVFMIDFRPECINLAAQSKAAVPQRHLSETLSPHVSTPCLAQKPQKRDGHHRRHKRTKEQTERADALVLERFGILENANAGGIRRIGDHR